MLISQNTINYYFTKIPKKMQVIILKLKKSHHHVPYIIIENCISLKITSTTTATITILTDFGDTLE